MGGLQISATEEWRQAHPGAVIGLLELAGVDNTCISPGLNVRKREIETRLREIYQGFTRQNFLALPVMSVYEWYYKRFSKTYHVLLQVESIALKGKQLPSVSPLVDANFCAEVETLILTAGHDAMKLEGAVSFDVSRPDDQMILMNGTAKTILAGDMIMKDAAGISCSIIYGQDNRSPISSETSHALYVAYAPAGIPLEMVETQLQRIEENIRLFSESVVVEQRRLLQTAVG